MPLYWIAMNVILMMYEIHFVADAVVGETALPDFLIAADDRAEFMRVCAFDQLNSSLDRHVVRRSQEQMNVFWHDDKRVQFILAFAAVSIDRFQKQTHVDFDHEQFSAVISREGHEVGSGRGEKSSRLQSATSAAESRTSLQTLDWHEWNSCPSR